MNIVLRGDNLITGLKELVEYIRPMMNQDSTMVELGSYVGESANIFLQSSIFKKIYCVDMWVGGYQNGDYASDNMEGAESKFDSNVGFDERIVKIKADTISAKKIIDDDIDFVYIDANHSYESCKNDILCWMVKTKIIGGHDYGDQFFGVKQAVNECFGCPDIVFSDSSWIKILGE